PSLPSFPTRRSSDLSAFELRDLQLLSGLHHGLRAVRQTVDFLERPRPAREFLEGALDAGEHRLERDTRFFPGFDERPIQGRKQRDRKSTRLNSSHGS